MFTKTVLIFCGKFEKTCWGTLSQNWKKNTHRTENCAVFIFWKSIEGSRLWCGKLWFWKIHTEQKLRRVHILEKHRGWWVGTLPQENFRERRWPSAVGLRPILVRVRGFHAHWFHAILVHLFCHPFLGKSFWLFNKNPRSGQSAKRWTTIRRFEFRHKHPTTSQHFQPSKRQNLVTLFAKRTLTCAGIGTQDALAVCHITLLTELHKRFLLVLIVLFCWWFSSLD